VNRQLASVYKFYFSIHAHVQNTICTYVKNLCAYLLNKMFNLLQFLGVDPFYISGQVGLLTVQIHSELWFISWNWSIIGNGNLS